MEENLSLYNKVKFVPEEAKKLIKGGRINGFTDINPMWRIKILTEQFGPVGFGWKYEIIKQWIEEGANAEKSAFTQIHLFVKNQKGEWSDAIPGIGGSTFVSNEKNGLYTSDECYKMSLTDAISVSCKALGIAADVYFEKDTSSKYQKENIDKKEEPNDLEKRLSVFDYLQKSPKTLQEILRYFNVGTLDDLSKGDINTIYSSYKKKNII